MGDAHTEAVHVHHAPTGWVRKYVFSLDHKVIGKQYYFLALFSVFVGMCLSILMRWHLVWPDAHIPGLHWLSATSAPNNQMTPEYSSVMTMHATLMVFFVLTTAPQSGFGNYFLPIQIGAEDMAFPTLNMLSFWTTFVALMVLIATFFVADGPPLSGGQLTRRSAVSDRPRAPERHWARICGYFDRSVLRWLVVGGAELHLHLA